MARSIWTGSLSFGLVNIPVKLITAVREERVAFHLLHDQDKVRLRQKMVCPEDGTEVHREHMIKGYEISPERYVVVTDSELEAVAPKSSRVIEIQDFVNLSDIDPVYFDRPYYLLPQQHAEKAYRLLAEAMEQTGKVGIAKFTMRSKEYLAALRPSEGVIVLETMHFSGEVTPTKKVDDAPREVKVDQRELSVAEKLIQSLSTDFKPEQYHDEYRDRVMELIQKKAHGEHIVVQPKHAEHETRAADLMAALEASLNKARRKGPPDAPETKGADEREPSERRSHKRRAVAHARTAAHDAPARRRKHA
ncbi:MAG TPA: Ku protein [Phycisphaerae bacterium]|nr:Ku protein [Phycisphaerae bacterium]